MTFTTRPELEGTFGVVSSTHWHATQSGMAILESGGNAFNAAVAAGFVLQVVELHLNGLGGEVPTILWDVHRHAVDVICGQGPAPAAATIELTRSQGLDEIPGSGLLGCMCAGRPPGTRRLRSASTPGRGYSPWLLRRRPETTAGNLPPRNRWQTVELGAHLTNR